MYALPYKQKVRRRAVALYLLEQVTGLAKA